MSITLYGRRVNITFYSEKVMEGGARDWSDPAIVKECQGLPAATGT